MVRNIDIAHQFSGDPFGEGSGSNFFYRDGRIYSYGTHFCISKVIGESSGGRYIALETTRSYSKTTGGHISCVVRATGHWNKIYVRDPDGYYLDNLRDIVTRLKSLLKKASSARFERTRDAAWLEFGGVVTNLKRYLDFLKKEKVKTSVKSAASSENKHVLRTMHKFLKLADKDLNPAEVDRLRKKLEAQRTRDERKRERAQVVRIIQDIKDWKKDVKRYISYCNQEAVGFFLKKEYAIDPGNFNTVLRFKSEEDLIQTSQGYDLTLKEGKLLYQLWKKGKAHGVSFKDWVVSKADSTGMHIGCHSVPAVEINAIAEELGWTK